MFGGRILCSLQSASQSDTILLKVYNATMNTRITWHSLVMHSLKFHRQRSSTGLSTLFTSSSVLHALLFCSGNVLGRPYEMSQSQIITKCGWLGHRWVCLAADCGSKVRSFGKWQPLVALRCPLLYWPLRIVNRRCSGIAVSGGI